MALSKDTLEWIAELSGVKVEDITAKISSEEEESIEKPQGEFYSEEELNNRDSNKYDEAKKAFEEMKVKELRKKLELDFEGKTFDNLFKHHEEKLKNKYQKDSSERVKELEADLAKVNQANEETVTNLTSELQSLKQQNKINGIKADLLGIMPAETSIPKEDVLTLFLSKHQVKENENGQTFIESNGQPLKDPKTQSYLDYKNVFEDFSENYKLKTPGRGEGNQNGNQKPGNEDQFIDNWEKQQNKPISSPEGVRALMEYEKQNAS
ncbi:hypothetical protein [Christiangramia crocea]|uniref:Phage capsid protein n=1 Tax=Christiangramia crocea TaxID=2904124 RepID=A0A9X2A7N7_9FLAO|nr:hypothetical protein [Gramella crocea]MCG9970998.1 hypothetical protein [Gramella crocea]